MVKALCIIWSVTCVFALVLPFMNIVDLSSFERMTVGFGAGGIGTILGILWAGQ